MNIGFLAAASKEQSRLGRQTEAAHSAGTSRIGNVHLDHPKLVSQFWRKVDVRLAPRAQQQRERKK